MHLAPRDNGRQFPEMPGLMMTPLTDREPKKTNVIMGVREPSGYS